MTIAPPPTLPEDAELAPGTCLDHYRVVRTLGRGGMGVVYLARDLRLGRQVALKLVASSALRSAAAVARFMDEARTMARFSHPHIVAVYGVGQVDDVAYIALEYVPGETLRARLDDGPLAPREVARLGVALADALAAAHGEGVLHRDLKPDNVMIGPDGRPRVLDFGLATAVDAPDTPGATWGTPAYMAPELWNGAGAGPASDVWALGVVLYELITGTRPWTFVTGDLRAVIASPRPAPDLPADLDAPPALRDLVHRCLAKRPDARPPAHEVRDACARVLDGGAAPADDQSPFRGLLPFDERHAGYFFGREDAIAEAVERLRHAPVLPVVGPSGAGKSSFVRAGLLPRLRDQGRWAVVDVRPGQHPFRALARALLAPPAMTPGTVSTRPRTDRAATVTATRLALIPAPRDPDDPDAAYAPVSPVAETEAAPVERAAGAAHDAGAPPSGDDPGPSAAPPDAHDALDALAERLRERPGALNLALLDLAERHGARVLLVVDQLEELETQAALDPPARDAFLEAVAQAADDAHAPTRVVFTLRDDFLGRVAGVDAARRALDGVLVLRAPGRDALRRALEEPARRAGYRFEDGLVDAMLAAVSETPNALPLVQFTARQLWNARDRAARTLTRAAYEAAGGVEGALATHADLVLAGLGPHQLAAAREVLLRLVGPDGTRRAVPRADVAADLGAAGVAVIGRLVDARLIAVRRGDGRGEGRLELVHESLVHHWGTLAGWLDESRHDIALKQELVDAAAAWTRRGRSVDALWRGARVAEAAALASRLSGDAAAFLAACSARERRARWLRRGAVAAALIVASVLALVFYGQAQVAEGARDALARERDALVLTQARGVLAEDPTAAVAWLGALRHEGDAWTEAAPVAWDAAGRGVARHVLIAHPGATARRTAASPDGARMASVGYDRRVVIWDPAAGTAKALTGHTDEVMLVDWSARGLIASGSDDGTVRLWPEGEEAIVLAVPRPGALAWSPDGGTLAAGDDAGRLHLFGPDGASLAVYAEHEAALTQLAWGPDGRRVVTTSEDGTARIHEPPGDGVVVLSAGRGRVDGVAWSRDGGLVATGSADGSVHLWRPDGREVASFVGHDGDVRAVAFAGAAGEVLVTGGRDGEVALWSLAGEPLRRLAGHQGVVRELAVSPDGRYVATGGDDRVVRIWDLLGGGEVELRGHRDRVRHVRFAADGASVVSAGADGALRVWPVAQAVHRLVGHGSVVAAAAFAPDRPLLATGAYNGEVRLWDTRGGGQIPLPPHDERVYAVAFDAAGEIVVSSSRDGTARAWTTTSAPGEIGVLPLGERGRAVVACGSPGRFALGDGEAVRLWEPLAERSRELGRHSRDVVAVACSPDGRWVASGDEAGTVRRWPAVAEGGDDPGGSDEGAVVALSDDVVGLVWRGGELVAADLDGTVVAVGEDGVARPLGRVAAGVSALGVARDGAVLLGSPDGAVARWRRGAARPEPVGSHGARVNAVLELPDGDLASGGDDGAVRIWSAGAPGGLPLPGARGRVTRFLVSPDGASVAVVSQSPEVLVWPRDLPREPAEIQAVRDRVTTARLNARDLPESPTRWVE